MNHTQSLPRQRLHLEVSTKPDEILASEAKHDHLTFAVC